MNYSGCDYNAETRRRRDYSGSDLYVLLCDSVPLRQTKSGLKHYALAQRFSPIQQRRRPINRRTLEDLPPTLIRDVHHELARVVRQVIVVDAEIETARHR